MFNLKTLLLPLGVVCALALSVGCYESGDTADADAGSNAAVSGGSTTGTNGGTTTINTGSTGTSTGGTTTGGSTTGGSTAGGTTTLEPYYATAAGLAGTALKARLHEIISAGVVRYSYDACWNQMKYIDENPNDTTCVIALYSGWSMLKSENGGGTTQWNREHTWAKSHGDFGTATGPGTDLHHLRPTDVTVNSKRGNLDFDNGGSPYNDPSPPSGVVSGYTGCFADSDSFEPRAAVKGDVARMMFYMAVMYEGHGGYDMVDLELNDSVGNTGIVNGKGYLGRISVLKAWHAADPVDDWERRRNNRTHEVQKNRNPFIDHPEWVASIWGN
jgi:endonuclease I